MKVYRAGTLVFCDFHFGGKPNGVCIEVLKPGNGKNRVGLVKVKITADCHAYRKGEILEVDSYTAVPRAQELPLKPGQFFRRLSTLYRWEKDEVSS